MTNTDRLTEFLYILMRDHVPSGVPEEIMLKHVDRTVETPVYSNPHLYSHARELAERINRESSW